MQNGKEVAHTRLSIALHVLTKSSRVVLDTSSISLSPTTESKKEHYRQVSTHKLY